MRIDKTQQIASLQSVPVAEGLPDENISNSMDNDQRKTLIVPQEYTFNKQSDKSSNKYVSIDNKEMMEEENEIMLQKQQKQRIRALRMKLSGKMLDNMNNSINFNLCVLLVNVVQVILISYTFYVKSGEQNKEDLSSLQMVLILCLVHQVIMVLQQIIIIYRLQMSQYRIQYKQYQNQQRRQYSEQSIEMADDEEIEKYQNPVVMQGLDWVVKTTYVAILVYASCAVFGGENQEKYDTLEFFTCTIIVMIGYLYLIFIFIVIVLILFCFFPFFLLIAIRTNYVKQFNKKKLDQYLKKQQTTVYFRFLEDKNIQEMSQPEVQLQNQGQDGEFCFLCQKSYMEDSIILSLKCNPYHFYHSDCVKKWFLISNNCPICKENIF